MATELQFIKSASGTSVSSLSVTDCFSADYDVYQVIMTDFVSTVGVNPRYQVINSSGVVTTNTYDWATLLLNTTSTFGEQGNTNINYIGLIGVVYENATLGIGTTTSVFNPYDSSSYTFFNSQASSTYNGNTYGYKVIGVEKTAQQITGINVTNAGSGTFSATVKVYGVK